MSAGTFSRVIILPVIPKKDPAPVKGAGFPLFPKL